MEECRRSRYRPSSFTHPRGVSSWVGDFRDVVRVEKAVLDSHHPSSSNIRTFSRSVGAFFSDPVPVHIWRLPSTPGSQKTSGGTSTSRGVSGHCTVSTPTPTPSSRTSPPPVFLPLPLSGPTRKLTSGLVPHGPDSDRAGTSHRTLLGPPDQGRRKCQSGHRESWAAEVGQGTYGDFYPWSVQDPGTLVDSRSLPSASVTSVSDLSPVPPSRPSSRTKVPRTHSVGVGASARPRSDWCPDRQSPRPDGGVRYSRCPGTSGTPARDWGTTPPI